MKYFLFILCLFSSNIHAKRASSQPYIHLVPGGGRFGDQLIHYIKAKWISYNNDIPLILTPNIHYKNLLLDRKETFFYTTPKSKHRKKINEINPVLDSKRGYYYVTYFPFPNYKELTLMRQDPVFLDLVKELISPIEPLKLLDLPSDMITVALHIRTESNSPKTNKSQQTYNLQGVKTSSFNPQGGDYMDFCYPNKFPPLQFYVDELKKLSLYFNHQPLYVYIFTDDFYPENIKNIIKKNVNLPNISYDYRKEKLHPDLLIKVDFFSMMQFDCLIRPKSSNYSLMVDFLGENKIVVAADTFHWEKDKNDQCYLIIDSVLIRKENEIKICH